MSGIHKNFSNTPPFWKRGPEISIDSGELKRTKFFLAVGGWSKIQSVLGCKLISMSVSWELPNCPFSGQLEYHCIDVFQRWHSLNSQHLVRLNSLVIPFPSSAVGADSNYSDDEQDPDPLQEEWIWIRIRIKVKSPISNRIKVKRLIQILINVNPHTTFNTRRAIEECLPGIKLRVLGPVVDLFLPCKKLLQ